MAATPADAVFRVLEVLDHLEIPYHAGSAIASSIYGTTQPGMDFDFVADFPPAQVDEFVSLLRADFYVDGDMIRDALARGRSFNLIHLKTSFKIDIFPLRKDEYSRRSFGRRRYEQSLSFGTEPIECAVATAEDTILRKLESYRKGGEVSERQWNDLRGILKISGAHLDYQYLREWAPFLKVEDLLERLLAGG